MSVVAPFYNEKESLPKLLERLYAVFNQLAARYRFEVILCDDGSTDGSLSIARALLPRYPELRVIELRKRYGQTAALQAGLSHAEGSIVVSMDADMQHFPEDLPLFLEKIETGCDVVCGWRKERKEGIVRRWPSRVANFLMRRISGLEVQDIGTTYRAYRREIIQDMVLLGESHRFVPVFARAAGARIEQVVIQNISRPYGSSNYGLSRTVNVFLDLFFLFFYIRYMDRPMRLFGKIGLFLLLLSSIITVGLIWVSLTTNLAAVRDHSGWFMLAIFFLITAVQVVMTGIVSEVIIRIYYATNDKGFYKVRREWNQSNCR